MKFSEAIALGSMIRPQGFGDLFHYGHAQKCYVTCAVGAALEAIGYTTSIAMDTLDIHDYPEGWATLPVTACPACGEEVTNDGLVIGVITHLNDHHLWTREDIARWVATVESLISASIEETVSQ